MNFVENRTKLEELEKENAFALVVAAGELQLQSGAEISRVEETMTHMASALRLDSLETFVIANGIFATAEGVDATVHSDQKTGSKRSKMSKI